jgi:F420-non-reducing hydrogenase iron-sulfur subunit
MPIRTVNAVMTKTVESTVTGTKTSLAVFHCFNSLNGIEYLDENEYEVKSIKLPCSGLNRDVILLRAFEAGADAVIVFACPVGSCHYIQGNLRAAKRVARVKKILDEIGLDGRRLNFYNVEHHDRATVVEIVQKTLAGLETLGPNPIKETESVLSVKKV